MSKVDDKIVVKKTGIKQRFITPNEGRDYSYNLIQNYDFVWDNDARDFKVVATDIEDREAYIQSFAAETGIYNIMKNYAKTGDISILNKKQGFYGDISGLPVDELNPAKVEEAAQAAVKSLNKSLGVNLTADELASMSSSELEKLIGDAMEAIKAKAAPAEKKVEGE